jgi:predicted N-formylglutamate amidohydrolase
MMLPWIDITGPDTSPFLLIADHASNRVPEGIDLGLMPELMEEHIALDIGVDLLGRQICTALGCPGILGGVSRLVVDLNREEDAPHIIPIASDGHAIPGNAIDHDARLKRIEHYWRPYHQRIADQIERQHPKLLLSLHSFTPKLASQPDMERPWQVGILYNQDDRAARIAIPWGDRGRSIALFGQAPQRHDESSRRSGRHRLSRHRNAAGFDWRCGGG